MRLLSVGTILCFVVIVAHSAEDRGLREGGRHFHHHHHHHHKMKKKGPSHFSMNLRRALGVLSYFDLSQGMKGMTCNGNRCHHYGDQVQQPKGKPKWVMQVKHTRYLCYSESVHDCPRFEGGTYKKYTGKALNEKLNHFQMVVCGKVFFCHAQSAKDCPKVPILETVWEKVTKEKVYILDKNNTIIICLARDIEKCHKKFGDSNWKPRDDVDDRGKIYWYMDDDGIKYYCKNNKKEDCEKNGGGEWKKYCEGDVEECEKGEWELELDDGTIICVAYSLDECEETYDGDWKPSKRGKNKDGKPKKTRWFTKPSGGATFYCDEREKTKCPKEFAKKGGRDWQETPPDDPFEEEDSSWELKIRGKILICVTSDVKFCKKAHKGHWKPSHKGTGEDGLPKGSKWDIDTGKAMIYCDSKSVKHCPKLGKGKWGPTDGEEPDEPEDEEDIPMWEILVGGKSLTCVAPAVQDCKKAQEGHWKPCFKDKDPEGVPEDSKWLILFGKAKLYCVLESSESCPKIKGKKWKKVPTDDDGNNKRRKIKPKENMWELKVGKGVIVCVARNVKDCEKMHKGHWKPSDRDEDDNGVPEDSKWRKHVGKIKIYCISKLPKSCPKVTGGGKWINVVEDSDEESQKNFPNDKRMIDAGKVAPHIEKGGGRFKPTRDQGSTVLLCYGSDSSNCPKGTKWVETKIDVGKKINNVISVMNIWVIRIDDVYVVCIAEELSSCKPEDNDEWSIIGGMRAGLWKSKRKNVHLYCEAAEESKCPEGFGGWKLVSMDQWDQKELPPDRKGDMWRMVSFEFTVFCGDKNKGKCPKLKDNVWHKVSGDEIDYSAYGKKVKYQKLIDKTLYHCTAKTEDACPELPNDEIWEKKNNNFTVEEVLELFEDIPGFKDSCYSGICKTKKNKAADPFDDSF